MKSKPRDHAVLRDLAKKYRELCDSDKNSRSIARWRDFNSMKSSRPLVWCNLGLLGADIDAVLPDLDIEDEDLYGVGRWFQKMLWIDTIGDDRVFDPWYAVRAEVRAHPEGVWGVAKNVVRDSSSRGWRNMPVLTSIDDLDRLAATPHEVLDPFPPLAARLQDIFGEILPVHVNRSTVYPKWGGTDLSEAAGNLLGLEELLYALYEKPEMVHRLMAFMRDAVIDNIVQCETAGDFSTAETQNYMVPGYYDDLPDPAANTHGVKMKELCFFTHAQEFETVGPEQHKEFLLDYQMPIMELFGKVNYGCCESLDSKLDILRQIPNLNKVMAGPLADVSIYPERIGRDCILSWRPNAAPMVCKGFDPDDVRKRLRQGLEITKGCAVEVHLHEPMTVENDISRVGKWARIAVQEAERVA